ncbi:hypothetical protein TB1_031326 [Malus domestica]
MCARPEIPLREMISNDVMHGRNLIMILLDPSLNHLALETASSRSLSSPPEALKFDDYFNSPMISRPMKPIMSSIKLNECKVYKTESVGESTGKAIIDVLTQTDEKRHQRRRTRRERSRSRSKSTKGDLDLGLSRDEISPPPWDSKPRNSQINDKGIWTAGTLHEMGEEGSGGAFYDAAAPAARIEPTQITQDPIFRDSLTTQEPHHIFDLYLIHNLKRFNRWQPKNTATSSTSLSNSTSTPPPIATATIIAVSTATASALAFLLRAPRIHGHPVVTDFLIYCAADCGHQPLC